MSERLDVRRMLIARGWQVDRRPGHTGLGLWGGETFWAPTNAHGDCAASRYDLPGNPTIGFAGDVPARVIVAACVALAADRMADVAPALSVAPSDDKNEAIAKKPKETR